MAARNLTHGEKFPAVTEEKGFARSQLISPTTKASPTRKGDQFSQVVTVQKAVTIPIG